MELMGERAGSISSEAVRTEAKVLWVKWKVRKWRQGMSTTFPTKRIAPGGGGRVMVNVIWRKAEA